ncbi:hypothetical protein F2Q68_00030174 [Brassica cretica]|uniref:Uncharacterized protein n=1 Tax=Brassica cretica TaxID=69181 RepID=A0A8S9GAV7_BRACR|nr:hypothetical protein F2Q68_00030174 [Brassica cretica]
MGSTDPPPLIKKQSRVPFDVLQLPLLPHAIEFEQLPHEKLISHVRVHHNFHPYIHKNFEPSTSFLKNKIRKAEVTTLTIRKPVTTAAMLIRPKRDGWFWPGV